MLAHHEYTHTREVKKPKLIAWGEIIWLSAPPSDPSKQREYYSRDGFLSLGGNRIYSLYWPMAMAAREAYRAHVGRYPPIDANESIRASGQKVLE